MKTQWIHLIPVVWLALLVTVGCSQQQEAAVPAGDAALIAGNWVLIAPTSTYTVTLQVAKTTPLLAGFYAVQLSGRSSVNTYFANASFSQGPSIESGATGTGSVSSFGSTYIGGSTAAQQFEDTYFAQLRAVNKAELIGTDRLQLSYGTAAPMVTAPGALVYKRQ